MRMRKLVFVNLMTAVIFGLFGSSTFADVASLQLHARYVCDVEPHGKTDVTIDQNGLLNAGRFGLYRIDRDVAQNLMRGSITLNECGTFPARDFYLTPGLVGTIKVALGRTTFVSRRRMIQLEIRASRNSVTLDNCLLAR